MLRRSNCLIYAMLLNWRLRVWVKQKPERAHWRIYRAKRQSDWGRFRHRLVIIYNTRTRKQHIVSWKPSDPVKRALPPPLFEGTLHWGDDFHG